MSYNKQTIFLQRRFQLHVHAPHSCHCNVGIWQGCPLAHFLLVILDRLLIQCDITSTFWVQFEDLCQQITQKKFH